MSKLYRDDYINLYMDHGIHIQDKVIYLDGDVNNLMLERLCKGIHLLTRLNREKDLTIILNSTGGDVTVGVGMYDLIRSLECNVGIYVVGEAHSMASFILQAADIRVMSPGSSLLIHDGSMDFSDLSVVSQKRWMDYSNQEDRRIKEVLLAKMQEKVPEMTIKKLYTLMQHDTLYTAEQALAAGLIDDIGLPPIL
jgi:ATP-dependent Clp protease protease subunit